MAPRWPHSGRGRRTGPRSSRSCVRDDARVRPSALRSRWHLDRLSRHGSVVAVHSTIEADTQARVAGLCRPPGPSPGCPRRRQPVGALTTASPPWSAAATSWSTSFENPSPPSPPWSPASIPVGDGTHAKLASATSSPSPPTRRSARPCATSAAGVDLNLLVQVVRHSDLGDRWTVDLESSPCVPSIPATSPIFTHASSDWARRTSDSPSHSATTSGSTRRWQNWPSTTCRHGPGEHLRSRLVTEPDDQRARGQAQMRAVYAYGLRAHQPFAPRRRPVDHPQGRRGLRTGGDEGASLGSRPPSRPDRPGYRIRPNARRGGAADRHATGSGRTRRRQPPLPR